MGIIDCVCTYIDMCVVVLGPDSSPVHIEQKIQSASLVSSTGAETALDITGLSVLSFRGALISK